MLQKRLGKTRVKYHQESQYAKQKDAKSVQKKLQSRRGKTDYITHAIEQARLSAKEEWPPKRQQSGQKWGKT